MKFSDWSSSPRGGDILGGPSWIAASWFNSTGLLRAIARTSAGVLLLAVIGGWTPAAHATSIVYTITPEALTGTPGTYTLTGTITTDGALGTLASSDVTAWSWSLTNGVTTYNGSGPPTTSLLVTELTATATALSVPFDVPVPSEVLGNALILQPSSNTNFLEFLAQTTDTSEADYKSFWEVNVHTGQQFTLSQDSATLPAGGAMVVATAAPEPSTAVLLALGAIAWTVGLARRRMRAAAA